MSNDLGIDRSGNNNSWTVNNMTLAADQMLDSPTNNFCTMNPISQNVNATLSEGNLKQTGGSTLHGGREGTIGLPATGKWYWEVYIVSTDSGRGQGVGVGKSIYRDVNDWGNYTDGMFYMGSEEKFDGSYVSYGANHVAGGIIGVAWNSDDTELTFYYNNSTQGDITSFGSWINSDTLVPIMLGRDVVWVANFGQDSSFAGNTTAQGNQDSNGIGDFYYTPPSGFLALCTANLDTPAVIPSEHFNAMLYTGNNSQPRTITGVGFQPDFVWIKNRAVTWGHALWDVLRGGGVDKGLIANGTNSEATSSTNATWGYLSGFDADGFTVNSTGSFPYYTNYTNHMISWNWKAGGSGSANTDGDMAETVTVSANVDAGFSIVTYTGDGSTATVGHGLSKAPEMVIVKKRSDTSDWAVLANNDATDYMELNLASASTDDPSYWNDTLPTTSVFTVGTSGDVNTDDETYVAYCFHSVDGYSKVGSYTGNGDADGTFVYTGFKVSYVMAHVVVGGWGWSIYDNARNSYNQMDKTLQTTSSVEGTSGGELDFLSNGFKWRDSTDDGVNNGDDVYIYLAFAETPFKYSNAK